MLSLQWLTGPAHDVEGDAVEEVSEGEDRRVFVDPRVSGERAVRELPAGEPTDLHRVEGEGRGYVHRLITATRFTTLTEVPLVLYLLYLFPISGKHVITPRYPRE